ncbi:hypothetical protein DNTS_022608 [Danionella cerebrum]|uniref:Uncharacterized protein n=1 Tax=Danionella cerebrum TaxID=2873325 RepID=A0A553RCV4_9TELE|nr:hypothetical protein DNTS_022608 [Danionella translucida]
MDTCCVVHNTHGELFAHFSHTDRCGVYVFAVSQSNSSLKKHRNRSIFSPFFCCFRDYNVEPPASNNSNNKTCSLSPSAEENSSPAKLFC